jgi:translation initiation factor 3 subunit L
VKQFVTYLYRHIKERSVVEIHSMYENSFNKITEKYFKQAPWPSAESIASLVVNGKHEDH